MSISRHISFILLLSGSLMAIQPLQAQLGFDLEIKKPEPYENRELKAERSGNIVVKEFLQLRGACNVTGNLSAAKLQVDPTATFNGQCQMGSVAVANATKASIVQMSTTDVQPAAEAK